MLNQIQDVRYETRDAFSHFYWLAGCLFGELKDMFPLKAAYALYLQQGEPHSARNFLKTACFKKLKQNSAIREETEAKVVVKGRNVVGTGSTLYFLSGKLKFI